MAAKDMAGPKTRSGNVLMIVSSTALKPRYNPVLVGVDLPQAAAI